MLAWKDASVPFSTAVASPSSAFTEASRWKTRVIKPRQNRLRLSSFLHRGSCSPDSSSFSPVAALARLVHYPAPPCLLFLHRGGNRFVARSAGYVLAYTRSRVPLYRHASARVGSTSNRASTTSPFSCFASRTRKFRAKTETRQFF